MIRKALFLPVALVSLAALTSACGAPQPVVEPAATPEPAAQQAPASAVPAQEPAKKEAEAPKKIEPVITVPKDAGLATPESVLYDAANDVYFVSSINGSSSGVDNNGFISKVSPEGKVIELKWAAGGAKGVKLDAPKGLAIVGDTLYVADITVVRTFELKTGKAKGDIKFEGASFLNDLFAGSDGKVWVTDSGIKITDKGAVELTKSDAVWVIEKGKAKVVARGEELGAPNGIVVVGGATWVVTFGSGELYRIDDKGKRQDVQKIGKGQLDGLLAFGDGLIITSWGASAVYRGKPNGTFEIMIPDAKAPADIGFDTKRSRLLLPLFKDDSIVAYDVK